MTLESLGDANIILVRVAEALGSPPGKGAAASLSEFVTLGDSGALQRTRIGGALRRERELESLSRTREKISEFVTLSDSKPNLKY